MPSTPYRSFLLYSRVAAVSVAAIALVVIIGGWLLDFEVLRDFSPDTLPTMKINTAVVLLLCAVAVGFASQVENPWAHGAALACAMLALLIAALTLVEYAFSITTGIDELLFPDRHTAVTEMPGRPAPNTALALCCAALALAAIDSRFKRDIWPAEWLALTTAAIGFLALTGLAYGSDPARAAFPNYTMALPTAVALLLLAGGILCARPDRGLMRTITSGNAGGFIARHLLPVALLVPPLIAWLALVGVRRGHIDVPVAMALLAMASVAVFMMFIWRGARSLNVADARRREAENNLRRANETLETNVAARTRELVQTNENLSREAAARRKTEEKLRWLLESAPDAIIVSDANGKIVLVNARTEELFGYAREELLGLAVEALVPARFRANHVRYRGSYASSPRTRMMGVDRELYAQRKDGSEFPVAISLSPIRIEQELLIFSDIRDVSWQRRAEQELRASEARFRAVVDTATEAVITADARGKIVYFNPAAERIFGYAAADVLHQSLTILMPERYRSAHAGALEKYLRTGETHVIGRTVELAGLRRDGSEFPLELSLARWNVGDQAFFTGILRDITARRESEVRIQELNRHLAQRAAELEAANRELESFSYSVSHDLRAPLRAIDGFSQLLLADNDKALGDADRDRLQRIRRAAQNMAELIDSLLKLARVARAEMVREALDLGAIARDVTEQLRRDEPERAVRVDVAANLAAVGDPRLLRIVVENLLRNAWKFTRHRADARIEFGAEHDGDETVFFVRDNGAGFEMAYVDKLFVPFQRLHDVTDYPGTGIGLATLQRVIRRHGGRVWAKGAPDQGATFYFTLGAPPPAAAAPASEPRRAEA